VPVVVPAVGAVAAAAGVVPRAGSAGVVAPLAAAAALAGWGVLRAEVLWTPVLPTELPFAVDRAVTALALGVPVGGAAVVLCDGRGRAPPGRPRRPPLRWTSRGWAPAASACSTPAGSPPGRRPAAWPPCAANRSAR